MSDKSPRRYGGETLDHFQMRVDIFLKDAENDQIILRWYFGTCLVLAIVIGVVIETTKWLQGVTG